MSNGKLIAWAVWSGDSDSMIIVFATLSGRRDDIINQVLSATVCNVCDCCSNFSTHKSIESSLAGSDLL